MKKSKYEFVYQSRLQRFCYVLSIILGMLIPMLPAYLLLNYLVHSKYVNESSDWFQWLAMFLPPVLMVFGVIIGAKIGMRWVSHGTLQLYSDYATLHYGNKTVQLKRNEFSVKCGEVYNRSRDPQQYYDIRMEGHKVRFYDAIISSFKTPHFDPSLSKAMMVLIKSGLPTLPREIVRALKKIKKRMKMVPSYNAERTLKIGDVIISIGVSTPEVFDNSLYYVDYGSCCATKNIPLCTCLVRELSDPEHVVGDIGFVDDEDNETPKPESVLRQSVIVEGAALDERIGTE